MWYWIDGVGLRIEHDWGHSEDEEEQWLQRESEVKEGRQPPQRPSVEDHLEEGQEEVGLRKSHFQPRCHGYFPSRTTHLDETC